MFRKIFYTPIPSWFLIVIVFLVAVFFSIFLFYFSDIVYDYDITIFGDKGENLDFVYGSWPALQNVKFFNEVRDRLIEEEADFVEGDLESMTLKVYKSGELIKEAKILSKGKDGSWWETPAGVYEIQGKEKTHFSSFGDVYMPWSMPFQGNFFVHGWPYYPGGEPVAAGYSGGCIRLSTEDAKAVFDLVQVGMPILVHDADFSSDNFKYSFRTPQISAESYLAADLQNNFVFIEKNSRQIRPIASLVKLVTALVATEYINIENKILIGEDALVPTSKPRLRAGSEVSVYNLLFPLLLESSNEAAEAIADTLGSERFFGLMNKKAEALGMKDTKLTDASGVDAGNVSTAEDLFVLSKYLYNNRSFILKISSGKLETSAYGESIFKGLENYNVFSGYPEFVGGKVGDSSAAGETLLSVFELDIKGAKRPIAIILLGSTEKEADAKALFDYVKVNYGL